MKVRLLKDVDTEDGQREAGDEIDHPDAQWLIDNGDAVAVEPVAVEQ